MVRETDVVKTGRTTAEKVMMGAFAVLALLVWVGVQAFLYRGVDPVAMFIGVVAVAGVALVATGRRWALVTATVLAALLFLLDFPKFLGQFATPSEVGWFVVSVVGLSCYLTILGAGARALTLGRRAT